MTKCNPLLATVAAVMLPAFASAQTITCPEPAEVFDLNKSELRLYKLLTNDLPNDYSVMLQVSYGAFLRNPSFKRYMTINSKRADFIILDVDLNVLAVIEYQGSGHFGNTAKSRDRAIRSDKVKRKALFEAGITLIEVPPKFDQNYIRTNLTDLTAQKTAVV